MTMIYLREQVLGWQKLTYNYNVTPNELVKRTGLDLTFLENSQLHYYADKKAVFLLLQLLKECGFYQHHEIPYTAYYFNHLDSSSKNMNKWLTALMNQPDFLGCLNLITKFSQNIYKRNDISYRVDGEYTYITHQFMTDEKNFTSSQGSLHALNQVLKKTAPYIDLDPEFYFTNKEIPNLDDFVKYNGYKVKFLQPFSGIRFKTHLLAVKNPYFNPLILNSMDSIINEVFLSFKPQEVVIERVKSIMNNYLNSSLNQEMSIKQMCQEMHMSSSTLQRHLAKEGQTYSSVLEDFKRTNAVKLLQNSHLQIVQISEKLGYANISSFDRAFKRWFGRSPLDFRNQGAE